MSNYEKWLEESTKWIEEADQFEKKQTKLYGILCIPGCAVVLGAIGLMSSGEISHVLQNALIGIPVGAVIGLMTALFMIPNYPSKKFKKSVKILEKEISAEDREAFATQLQGNDGEITCVTWKNEHKTEDKVYITKDFVVKLSGVGVITVVKLAQLDKIELKTEAATATGRGGGVKITQTTYYYQMLFYYKKEKKSKYTFYDVGISFLTREKRVEAVDALTKVLGTDSYFVEV